MTAEDRVSSLRIRIGRVRAGFDKRVNIAKLAFGVLIVAAAAIGLYLMF